MIAELKDYVGEDGNPWTFISCGTANIHLERFSDNPKIIVQPPEDAFLTLENTSDLYQALGVAIFTNNSDKGE